MTTRKEWMLWIQEARERVESLPNEYLEPLPPGADPALHEAFYRQNMIYLPLAIASAEMALEAAEHGDVWAALSHAKDAGRNECYATSSTAPVFFDYGDLKLERQKPLVAGRLKHLTNVKKGADERRKETPSVSKLETLIRAKQSRGRNVSRTEAIKRVAKDLGFSERTLRRRLKAAQENVDNLSVP